MLHENSSREREKSKKKKAIGVGVSPSKPPRRDTVMHRKLAFPTDFFAPPSPPTVPSCPCPRGANLICNTFSSHHALCPRADTMDFGI